jgi:predicted RNA binding protein YcfA (HicA-like mRNA interferase family)
MKLPILSAREVIKILEKQGFVPARQEGSHIFFKNPDGRTATVPDHPGRDLSRGILRKIIRDMGITREQFIRLYKGK